MLKEADSQSRRKDIDAKKKQEIVNNLDEILESYKDLADDINKCYGATENGATILGRVVDLFSELKKLGWEPPTSYDRLSKGSKYMADSLDKTHKELLAIHNVISQIYNTIMPVFNDMVKNLKEHDLDREIDATEDENRDLEEDQSKGGILNKIFGKGKK